jgi:hypothetical protein
MRTVTLLVRLAALGLAALALVHATSPARAAYADRTVALPAV